MKRVLLVLCVVLVSIRPLFAQLAVGPVVNITKTAGNQADTTIAVDPSNPLRQFMAANSSVLGFAGSRSTDGGQTWVTSTFGVGGGEGLTSGCCDASAAFDSFGNLWLAYLNGNGTQVSFALSTDGGQTWSNLPPLASGSVDQPTVAVGPGATPGSVTVWVTFDDSNKVAVVGAPVTALGSVGTMSALRFVPGSTGGDYSDLAVGPAGEVIVAYQAPRDGEGPATIYTSVDPDGLGPAPFRPSVAATSTNVGGFDFIPAQSSRSIDAEPGLDWDRSGGLYNNRIYLVYTDEFPNESNDTDIFLRYSDDLGATWSYPVRVNDDPGTRSQFLPHVAVDQGSGSIAVTWADCRNDSGSGPGDTDGIPNDDAEEFGALSIDGGNSFLANVQISAAPSNAAAAHSRWDLGDYDGLVFVSGKAYPAWADNSNSTGDNPDGTLLNLDIYTARLTDNTGGAVLSMAPAALPDGVVNLAREYSIHPTAGLAPFVFQQTGSLPPGVSVNCSATGCDVTGVPTVQGSYSFHIQGTDANNVTGGRDYTLQIAPSCLFCDDFEDGVLDPNWDYRKPFWTEGGGSLNGAPQVRKAIAVADPAFAGCSQCSVETMLHTPADPGFQVTLFAWYQDKRNTVEVVAKPGSWILRRRVLGAIVAQTKGVALIQPNTGYDVRVSYDGSALLLRVNGSLVAGLAQSGTLSGTTGFAVKKTTASFDFIIVE